MNSSKDHQEPISRFGHVGGGGAGLSIEVPRHVVRAWYCYRWLVLCFEGLFVRCTPVDESLRENPSVTGFFELKNFDDW